MRERGSSKGRNRGSRVSSTTTHKPELAAETVRIDVKSVASNAKAMHEPTAWGAELVAYHAAEKGLRDASAGMKKAPLKKTNKSWRC